VKKRARKREKLQINERKRMKNRIREGKMNAKIVEKDNKGNILTGGGGGRRVLFSKNVEP
jgi:hypothetical protein